MDVCRQADSDNKVERRVAIAIHHEGQNERLPSKTAPAYSLIDNLSTLAKAVVERILEE
jgi:hypothetical protein